MKINLTPYAVDNLIEIEQEEYQRLIQQKKFGWSVSLSHYECMSKLHYLREGWKSGKIDDQGFREKEKALALNWWRQAL